MSETSSTPCNLCGNHHVSVLSMRSRSGAQLRTVICDHCGLVWSDPFPHDPRQFYEEEYRLDYKKTYAPQAKHILRAGRVAIERHDKIKHLLQSRKNMLDVGTGGGEFAYLMKALGHDIQGIEPNKGYAEYSKAQYQLNLQVGFVQDGDFTDASFDLITIWHVLEHTADPGSVLGILRKLLKPDATLVVEVPNVEAVCQSPASSFHEAHLFNFNVQTLQKMGEKAGLHAVGHLLSADGGNLTMFFQPTDTAAETDWRLPGNAERISAVVKGHTNLRHYMRAAPYLRFVKKLQRTIAERNLSQQVADSKTLLDQLYREHRLL
ncbi:class I SAM-dependent methyltransferase [Methylomonas sp. SURF-1]|uniref:Class I SAM-dependent methyltransferase n=1 Tax=Methylomonas aurea TaxID=2952224 RepID=A0ABT1UDG1_9GAMM|nr:class I SAM-dependent methyltransferase [Methylomonas sp. SURF-1]MCQ8179779.1 class I SAM-dependent methyltransferase [Methylomonas sp. SURF-1]